jgi:putative transposase
MSSASDRGLAAANISARSPTNTISSCPSFGISTIESTIARRASMALAESVIGLYKTEVIARRGRWSSLEAVEFATLRWVDWFNHRRLLGPIGFVPPAEYEAHYYQQVSVA